MSEFVGLPINFLVLIASLFVLVIASKFFTNSAEKIGSRFGLSSFMIGVIIVSIGTSLPELANSILSVLEGSSQIGVGNVVGSNISNILLVFGIAAVFSKRKIVLHKSLQGKDVLFFIFGTAFLFLTLVDGQFIFYEGIIGIMLYLFYILGTRRRNHVILEQGRAYSHTKDYVLLGAMIVLIYFAAKYVVGSVLNISEELGIASGIIAVSVVALGTTLPEMVTSLINIGKGRTSTVFGTIIGSCIFNSFVVTGLPSLIGPLKAPIGFSSIEMPFLAAAAFICVILVYRKKINSYEGAAMVGLYFLFMYLLFSA